MNLRIVFLALLFVVIAAPSGLCVPPIARDVAIEDFQKADEEMNRAYQQVLGQLSPKKQDALKEAQSAWVAFRDKSARAHSIQEESGRTPDLAYDILYFRCRKTLTEARTKELTSMFSQESRPH